MKVKTDILFILSFALFSCKHLNKDLNCKDFKTGVFHYTPEQGGTSYKIFRSDSLQREYNMTNGSIVWAKIKWINDCKCELQYIDEMTTKQDSIVEHLKSHIWTTEILKTVAGEVNGTRYNYCLFESSLFGVNQLFRDTLWKHEITD
jgi:hypothetical protein